MTDPIAPIARRIADVFGLEEDRARSLVREVVDAFDTTVDEFIARRHDELKQTGISNDAAYSSIREELAKLRFRAPDLSERQIRRRIYG